MAEKQETIKAYEYDTMLINISTICNTEPLQVLKNSLIDFGEVINFDITKPYTDLVTGSINEVQFWRQLDIRNYDRVRKYVIRSVADFFDARYSSISAIQQEFQLVVINELPKDWFEEISEHYNVKCISLSDVPEKPYTSQFYTKIKEMLPNQSNTSVYVVDNEVSRLIGAGSAGFKTCLLLEQPLVRPQWYPDIVVPSFELIPRIKNLR